MSIRLVSIGIQIARIILSAINLRWTSIRNIAQEERDVKCQERSWSAHTGICTGSCTALYHFLQHHVSTLRLTTIAVYSFNTSLDNYCLSNPNWKCWLYPNAQDLMQDRHVNPIDITDKMQYFDTGIPSAETSATDVDATSAPSSNTPTTSQPEARSPLTETPFDRWCRENLDSL